MPVFFTPWLLTRLALMACPVETTTETSSAAEPVEKTVTVEKTESVEKVESVEKTVATIATMKMSKAELQALATKQNVKFAKSWNKTKLVEAINA